MEYGIQPMKPFYPHHLSGYLDAFVQNTLSTTHDHSVWMATLACLRTQERYLENQLSRAATTLNALRDRQTRNERALSMNPRPRSKKKQILQNRWRTDKTIKTSENEERVILDCLQVCMNNIRTLESIILPTDASPMVFDNISNNSCPDTASTATEFDWNGWSHENGSPFQRVRSSVMDLDEVPPEACMCMDSMVLEDGSDDPKRPLPLHPGARPIPLVFDRPGPVPLNTANAQIQHSMLSPEATCFEPSDGQDAVGREGGTIKSEDSETPTLSALRRIQLMQKRRFSDAAIGRISDCLPHVAGPALLTRQHSWAPDTLHGYGQNSSMLGEALRRMETV